MSVWVAIVIHIYPDPFCIFMFRTFLMTSFNKFITFLIFIFCIQLKQCKIINNLLTLSWLYVYCFRNFMGFIRLFTYFVSIPGFVGCTCNFFCYLISNQIITDSLCCFLCNPFWYKFQIICASLTAVSINFYYICHNIF